MDIGLKCLIFIVFLKCKLRMRFADSEILRLNLDLLNLSSILISRNYFINLIPSKWQSYEDNI